MTSEKALYHTHCKSSKSVQVQACSLNYPCLLVCCDSWIYFSASEAVSSPAACSNRRVSLNFSCLSLTCWNMFLCDNKCSPLLLLQCKKKLSCFSLVFFFLELKKSFSLHASQSTVQSCHVQVSAQALKKFSFRQAYCSLLPRDKSVVFGKERQLACH